jgi:hypothetical protein
MSSPEDYLGRVNSLVWTVADLLSSTEKEEVQHLIDHGEPAEGLRTLAWIIVEGDKRVSAATIQAIRELSEGPVPAEHMPADLDKQALDAES